MTTKTNSIQTAFQWICPWVYITALFFALVPVYANSETAVSGQQITDAPHGHILTNAQVWSPDSQWLVYDLRPEGGIFRSERIERVNVETGEIQVLYEAQDGANCGVVTCHPFDERIIFIHGPEYPEPSWSYRADHRRGVIVDSGHSALRHNMDARDLTAPFTPGALRGGTHVHLWSGDGQWVASTYEDHLFNSRHPESPTQRQLAISVPWQGGIAVKKDHPRNHDGSHFTVVVTTTTESPVPGSDEIRRAANHAWVGEDGYLSPDGKYRRKAIAFDGLVHTERGDFINELFIVDLPDNPDALKAEGIEGSISTLPKAPASVVQRRLTHTVTRKYPGLAEPRHWPVSSPDGKRIAFLMRDNHGIVQLYTITPWGGNPRRLSALAADISSAFSWSPDGRRIACISDGSVWTVDVKTGDAARLTARVEKNGPGPHACVFSPDGKYIAYIRPVPSAAGTWDQIFVLQAK